MHGDFKEEHTMDSFWNGFEKRAALTTSERKKLEAKVYDCNERMLKEG